MLLLIWMKQVEKGGVVGSKMCLDLASMLFVCITECGGSALCLKYILYFSLCKIMRPI